LLAPEDVLTKYVQALDTLKTPAAYTFEYAFAHHGSRPQEVEHRIFRQGSRERDELVGYNGERLTHPEIRVFTQHRDPYNVAALAPRADDYAFTYGGQAKVGRSLGYVFNTFAKGAPEYEVTRMVVDSKTFLPLLIEFHAKAGTVFGTGNVTYAKADHYWMPQSATARAVVNGDVQTERIDWSHYQFYPNLPPATFAEPRSPQTTPSG
jgi:hypothetical protein